MLNVIILSVIMLSVTASKIMSLVGKLTALACHPTNKGNKVEELNQGTLTEREGSVQ
jgi:hypothetical protein